MKKAFVLMISIVLCLSPLAGCSKTAGGPAASGTPAAAESPAPSAAEDSATPAAPTATAEQPEATATPEPSPSPVPVGALPEGDYAYFERVGFGGLADGSPCAAKWSVPIRIQVVGAPTNGDRAALNTLVNTLKAVSGMPDINYVTEGGNITIGYVPKSKGNQIEPQYNGTDDGQVFIKWGQAGSTVRIVLADEMTDQQARDSSFAAFLFRGLGLSADPQQEHADSVLGGAAALQPSKLDWLMLALLYSPTVKAGMKQDEAMAAVRGLDDAAIEALTPTGGSPVDAGDQLSYFNEVGFYWGGGGSDGIVSKWAAPIKLQIKGSPGEDQQQLLDAYIARLNGIRGFPGITVVQSGGNFIINYAAHTSLQKNYGKLTAAEACYYEPSRGRNGTITGCTLGVATDFKDAVGARSQFLRVFIWSLGINFTSDTWPDSILNFKANAGDWSKLDWLMAGLLYRADVKVGAKRAAVMTMLQNTMK